MKLYFLWGKKETALKRVFSGMHRHLMGLLTCGTMVVTLLEGEKKIVYFS